MVWFFAIFARVCGCAARRVASPLFFIYLKYRDRVEEARRGYESQIYGCNKSTFMTAKCNMQYTVQFQTTFVHVRELLMCVVFRVRGKYLYIFSCVCLCICFTISYMGVEEAFLYESDGKRGKKITYDLFDLADWKEVADEMFILRIKCTYGCLCEYYMVFWMIRSRNQYP